MSAQGDKTAAKLAAAEAHSARIRAAGRKLAAGLRRAARRRG